jgi:cell division transport system permease protein
MWEDISMREHKFSYFFHEGLSNMFSHGFMSFAAIGITVACLLIMGTFTLVAVNADALLQELESANEILAYVDDSYSESEAKALQSQLEKLTNVKDAAYISKESAMQSFQEQYPDEQMFQDLDAEIFRDRFAIHIDDLSKTNQTVQSISNVTGIVKVSAYEEISNGFITVRNVTSVVCVALILILFIVSVFIISNTIKLTTFDRREEIAIMRMVGATNGFIRWPFVYEGFMLGFLGAVIAFFLQWALYEAVAKGVSSSDTLQLVRVLDFSTLWGPVALTFAGAGIVIGVGGSLSAIRKFLQA